MSTTTSKDLLQEVRDWLQSRMPCGSGQCCDELRAMIAKLDAVLVATAEPAVIRYETAWAGAVEVADDGPPFECVMRFNTHVEAMAALASINGRTAQPPSVARPRSEWHEDTGPVLWWHFPIDSPPFCGTPNDSDWPERDDQEYPVENGYYTHFTQLEIPTEPST